MKRINLFARANRCLPLLAAALLVLTACGKDNEKVHASDIFTSGCMETKFTEDEEGWNVYWSQGDLVVAHTGWMVPCDLHNVTVSVEVEGSVVTINECGEGGEVNCLCDKHNSFNLVGLDHGTYTFVFKVCGEEKHRQEFTI